MPRTSNKPRRPEIPTALLSELASSSASGADSRGSPYSRPVKGGKPHMSRKDARKQQRDEKKQRKATHHARMHEKPAAMSTGLGARRKGQAAATVASKKQAVAAKPPKVSAAPSGDKDKSKAKQRKQQPPNPTASEKKPKQQPTVAKKSELTDQEKMLKLAKKDPALLATLRSQGLIPSTAGLSDGEMGRDETIDRMDIARYEKLLKLNKRKRKKKAAVDGEDGVAENKPASVPKSIAHDGLGDLFAMVGGVTSKGEVSVVANPTVHVESDGEEVDEEDDEEMGGGDMYADAMSDEKESGDEFESDENESDEGEGVSEDSDEVDDIDMDSDQGDDAPESDLEDEDDKYLAGLGLDDLEGMLGGGGASSGDDESSSQRGDDDDDEMEMDSDLEAEMREILARPEYAEGGLDSFDDDSESKSEEESDSED
ncbi:hypothetical protein BCR44DRAFT_34701, partial [Catenaria anguillulae PL171]